MEKYIKIPASEIAFFKNHPRWGECYESRGSYFIPEDLYAEVYGYQKLDF